MCERSLDSHPLPSLSCFVFQTLEKQEEFRSCFHCVPSFAASQLAKDVIIDDKRSKPEGFNLVNATDTP